MKESPAEPNLNGFHKAESLIHTIKENEHDSDELQMHKKSKEIIFLLLNSLNPLSLVYS